MLWSEADIALNDVLLALGEAADLYQDEAELAERADSVALFQELAERRRRLHQALAEQIRRRGELPPGLDTDRETLMKLGKRLRAALSADEEMLLRADRRQSEDRIAELLQTALANVDDPEARALLEQIKLDVNKARQQLGEPEP